MDAQVIERIQRKYELLAPEMDERMRRQWAATEARELGWGGVTAVAQATGLSRPTITAGLRELDLPHEERIAEAMRTRRPGGGRKALTETDPQLMEALESLMPPQQNSWVSSGSGKRPSWWYKAVSSASAVRNP